MHYYLIKSISLGSCPFIHVSLGSGPLMHTLLGSGPLMHRQLGSGPLMHRQLGSGPLMCTQLGSCLFMPTLWMISTFILHFNTSCIEQWCIKASIFVKQKYGLKNLFYCLLYKSDLLTFCFYFKDKFYFLNVGLTFNINLESRTHNIRENVCTFSQNFMLA